MRLNNSTPHFFIVFLFVSCFLIAAALPSYGQAQSLTKKNFTFIELKPVGGRLTSQIQAEIKKAKQKGQSPFVYFHAEWCPPCKSIVNSMSDQRTIEAFEGTYIIQLDDTLWRNRKERSGTLFFNESGFQVYELPMFFAIDESGTPTGKTIGGSDWKENVPENMAPVLRDLFKNNKNY